MHKNCRVKPADKRATDQGTRKEMERINKTINKPIIRPVFGHFEIIAIDHAVG